MNDREELSCFKSSRSQSPGVLVAISIPIFTSQLEKSRDAVTASNVRAAYAEASAAKLTASDGDTNVKYDKTTGKVTVDKIAVKGQSANGAFGKDAVGSTAAVASQFDFPFTLGSGVAAKLDSPAGEIKLVFSWADDGTCTVNLPA